MKRRIFQEKIEIQQRKLNFQAGFGRTEKKTTQNKLSKSYKKKKKN